MKLEQLDLGAVLEQVGREKNIGKEVLVSALEDAMLSAARKKLGLDADLEARYNEEIGEVEVYEFLRIIKDGEVKKSGEIFFKDAKKLDPDLTEEALGEDLGVKLESSEFGRIAAQNAKQIIVQRVREAERMMVYNEYKDRKGEIATGTVRRFERGDVIVDLGRAEAILPTSEQISKENIRIHDRIVAYVVDVLEVARGAQIILSRTHPNLVVKLFEQEVPEIAEGIVSIESAAREAGFRTKISVRSKDQDVDPVGACVGMKGARVQAVVQELRGEKIDIVPYDLDEARFVCNALAPAEATRVLINEEERSMQIVVPDEQLSLAIGRRGQNVRLASQLTGWKIDIQAESKAAAEKEEAWVSLSQIKSLSELQFQTLFNYGIKSVTDFLETDNDTLETIPGFEESDFVALKAEAENVKKSEEERKVEQGKLVRIFAKVLLVIDEVCSKLAEEDRQSELALDSLGIESKEKLEAVGFSDLVDVFLCKDAQGLAKSADLDLDTAKVIFEVAKKKLAALDSRISC
ncbi:MAG: transcription termination/antitermination protein NusA [Myxococcales bacterium]|nr:transcription termination/antitermination protein NusA [Myxococcales bacterium]USN50779.1 MAG: transcription termination/antitermination protein NusA [Myxococcales bacterium]